MKTFPSPLLRGITAAMLLATPFVVACGDHDEHHNHLRATDHSAQDHRHLHAYDEDPNRFLEEGITEECGADIFQPSLLQKLEDAHNMEVWKESRTGKEPRANYFIPIWFHIIKLDDSEMVSDQRVQDYVNYLNDAFTNSGAPFTVVYQGTTQTVNADWSNDCYTDNTQDTMKGSLRQGGAETLNVYICNNVRTTGGTVVAGYAYFPGSYSNGFVRDGVVLNSSSSDRRLNTLVHEVVCRVLLLLEQFSEYVFESNYSLLHKNQGHYMGLYHTFNSGSTCSDSAAGDRVDDTPQHLQRSSSVNCHTDPSTWDTCPSQPGTDPVDNYMSKCLPNLSNCFV